MRIGPPVVFSLALAASFAAAAEGAGLPNPDASIDLSRALRVPLIRDATFGPFEAAAAPVTSEARFDPRPPRHPAEVRIDRRGHEPRPHRSPDPLEGHFLGLTFALYRDTLTRIDGPRCAHAPVCSIYGRDAVARYGLLGVGLGIDRLYRGALSSPLRRLPQLVEADGALRIYDPLVFSSFWLEETP